MNEFLYFLEEKFCHFRNAATSYCALQESTHFCSGRHGRAQISYSVLLNCLRYKEGRINHEGSKR